MPDFTYVARAGDGSLAQGTLTAKDRAAAIQQIEEKKQVPIKLELASGAPPTVASKQTKSTPPPSRQSVKPASTPSPTAAAPPLGPTETLTLPLPQLFLFTEQLAHLLVAGMTLDESLKILVQRLQQPRLQHVSRVLHQGLVDGRSLSQSMKDFPRIFDSLYVNMISAGEASGTLPQILRRLVSHIASIKSLRDRVKQALLYPSILVLSGIALIIIFMTVMVPQLTSFFTSTGQKLPLPTEILLSVNRLLTYYWWVAAALGTGAYFLWKTYTHRQEGRLKWDQFKWNFPGFGRIPRYRFYAQFARTLATLTENGVTLLKSLELLEDIGGNEWVRLQLVEVRKNVMDGASLSNALRQNELFPILFLDMMSVGEQTGRFADTMHMIADVHERELDKQVQFVSSLAPIIVIIAIAIVVGFVVFGILAAVFNLTSGLHHQGR